MTRWTADMVVVKLSGESLAKDGNPIHPDTFAAIATELVRIHKSGTGVAVVVGGGNLFRGGRDSQLWRMSPARGDRVGMYATGLNGMLLAEQCQLLGLHVAEFTSGPCTGFGQADWTPEDVKTAIAHGAVPIISGGLGEPGVSTDSPAVQLGIDLGARSVIMAKYGVDGAYTADPYKHSDAVLIPSIKASEALDGGIAVMDRYALELCRDSQTAVHIVGADEPHKLFRASCGEELGTMILPETSRHLVALAG